MKKTAWIIALLIWFFSLMLLTIAITDLDPENPIKKYRLIVGLGFLVISGSIRFAYKKHKRNIA